MTAQVMHRGQTITVDVVLMAKWHAVIFPHSANIVFPGYVRAITSTLSGMLAIDPPRPVELRHRGIDLGPFAVTVHDLAESEVRRVWRAEYG